MSDTMNNENTEMKYLGVEATERLIENLSANMQNSLLDKLSYNEQTLTPEQQEQVRKNIGVVQPDYAQNDPAAPDYIKNRLAYTEPRVLTYDGALDKRGESNSNGIYSVRVSDELIDLNSVKKVELTPANGDPMTFEVNSENSYIEIKDGYPCMFGILNGLTAPVIYVITSDVDFGDLGCIKAGTYFYGYENQNMVGYISRVEYGEEIVHKLDPKYLPEGGFGYIEGGKFTHTIEWDGEQGNRLSIPADDSGSMVLISDVPIEITHETLKSFKMKDGNEEVDFVQEGAEINIEDQTDGSIHITAVSTNDSPSLIFVNHQDVGEEVVGIAIPKGIYFYTLDNRYVTSISVDANDESIHKIDPKFLPEGGFGYTEGDGYLDGEILYNEDFPLGNSNDGFSLFYSPDFYDWSECPIEEGKNYHITIGDKDYYYTCKSTNDVMDDADERISRGLYVGDYDTLRKLADGSIGISSGELVLLLFSFDNIGGEDDYNYVFNLYSYGITFDSDEVNVVIREVTGVQEIIHKIDPKYLPEVEAVEPDWTENDESANGYIKNRPFYDGEKTLKLSKGNTIEAPFTKDELVGLKIVNRNKNRWRLKTPSKRITEHEDNGLLIFRGGDPELSIGYSTNGGTLSKNCLNVGCISYNTGIWNYCPKLFGTDFNALFYVYDTTSDNLGLGITLEQGWYAVNLSTYNLAPIELGEYDFIIPEFAVSDGYVCANEEYFKDCLTNEDITYTVTADDVFIAASFADKNIRVTYSDLSNVTGGVLRDILAFRRSSFVYDVSNNTLRIDSVGNDESGFTISGIHDIFADEVFITYPYLKRIEPKFLPEGGFGYTAPKALTFDGNAEGKSILDFSNSDNADWYCVKVTDEIIDLETVTRCEFVNDVDGSIISVEINSENSTIQSALHESIVIVSYTEGQYPVVVTVDHSRYPNLHSEREEGTYVVVSQLESMKGYISRIEFGETVHQIDSKYIPAALITDSEADALIASII